MRRNSVVFLAVFFAAILLCSAFVHTSCTKENESQDTVLPDSSLEVSDGGAERNVSMMQQLQSDEVGRLVLEHYGNISTLSSVSGELMSYIAEGNIPSGVEQSPFLLSLMQRDIVDLETGKPIDIRSLDAKERALLLADMMMDDMDRIASRLRESPEALKIYRQHSMVVGQVAQRYGSQAGVFAAITQPAMRGYTSGTLGSMALPSEPAFSVSASILHDELNAAFEKMEVAEESNALDGGESVLLKGSGGIGLMSSGSGSGGSKNNVPLDRVLAKWSQHSGRGRLLIRLPNHYSPRTWAREWENFGHVGIMSNYVGRYATVDSQASVDAAKGAGVHRRSVGSWLTKHYVARVDHVVYGRKPRKWWQFRGDRYVKSRTPIDGNRFADYCEYYIGRRYTPWFNMLIMKNEAPATFTCTTLAWYCAKRSSGVDISNTSWQALYPNEIYLDDNVAILADVQ